MCLVPRWKVSKLRLPHVKRHFGKKEVMSGKIDFANSNGFLVNGTESSFYVSLKNYAKFYIKPTYKINFIQNHAHPNTH